MFREIEAYSRACDGCYRFDLGSRRYIINDFNYLAEASEKDENVSCIEGAKSQVHKDIVTPNVATLSVPDITTTSAIKPNVTTVIATDPKTDIFDITNPFMRDPPTRIQKNHPTRNIIGNLTKDIRTKDRPRINYQDMV